MIHFVHLLEKELLIYSSASRKAGQIVLWGVRISVYISSTETALAVKKVKIILG